MVTKFEKEYNRFDELDARTRRALNAALLGVLFLKDENRKRELMELMVKIDKEKGLGIFKKIEDK